jgi:YHS domain-containing protein
MITSVAGQLRSGPAGTCRHLAGKEGDGAMTEMVTDPVCGMKIHPEDAVAGEEHDGRVFYFCSVACHDAFVRTLGRYGHPDHD